MKALKIHKEKIDKMTAEQLINLCPFSAILYENGSLSIGAGCKMCGLCVKNGPAGAVTLEDEIFPITDKAAWRGVAVYAELYHEQIHNVVKELLGKAVELVKPTGHPIYALLIGSDLETLSHQLLCYGADRVYVYDHPQLSHFDIEPYANMFSDFIERVKPSCILVGATNTGRSLAPRVAARFRTGLTADCTALMMQKNTDLIQIRPAFGGNIMAQIMTPKHRPQFCTVRYKTFSEAAPVENPSGVVERMRITPENLRSSVQFLDAKEKPREIDLSEAKTIVVVGRGVKNKTDLTLAEKLAELLGAQLACTRPLVENGWFDAKRQIGLSGRTVNADFIITLGVSGSVQFAAGMRSSQCIMAINKDRRASIFDIAHYGLLGDLYEIVPALFARLKEAKLNVQ